MLLSASGYAPANPPEWLRRLGPQFVLLGVAAGGGGVHAAEDGSGWVDRIEHVWGADVGGNGAIAPGGEEIG